MSLITQQTPAADKTKFALVFSYTSFILIGIVNTFLGPILPFLTDKWTINDGQAGYFLAAQSLGGMVGTLTTSLLFTKIGSRRILLGGYILLAFSLFGISSEIWEIGLLSSLINGISIGIVIPTTTLVVSQAAREKTRRGNQHSQLFLGVRRDHQPAAFFQLKFSNAVKFSFNRIRRHNFRIYCFFNQTNRLSAGSQRRTIAVK